MDWFKISCMQLLFLIYCYITTVGTYNV